MYRQTAREQVGHDYGGRSDTFEIAKEIANRGPNPLSGGWPGSSLAKLGRLVWLSGLVTGLRSFLLGCGRTLDPSGFDPDAPKRALQVEVLPPHPIFATG